MATRTSSDTLARLYEAAIALIGEHGYSATTVDEIAARAGVAKGTVYYHFKGKTDLVSALLEDGLQRLAASFSEEIRGTQGPAEALRALVHAELTYIQRDQAFSKLVMSQMWRVDGDWQVDLRLLREQYVSVFAGVIAEGVEAGAFRAGLDAQAAASTVFGMIATGALDWLVFKPEKTLDEVEATLSAMVLGAVGAAG
jgi:TetR/AcrR family transcriptional regulator, cholesterol catabolism regulator